MTARTVTAAALIAAAIHALAACGIAAAQPGPVVGEIVYLSGYAPPGEPCPEPVTVVDRPSDTMTVVRTPGDGIRFVPISELAAAASIFAGCA